MSETANDKAVTALSAGTSSDSIPAKRPRGKAFAPGYDARRNTAGRPKTRDTVLSLTLHELHKRQKGQPTRATQAAVAHADRMMLRNQAGNQAWDKVVNYESGLPKQVYVVEQADSPLAELLRDLAVLNAATPAYDVESTAIEVGGDYQR